MLSATYTLSVDKLNNNNPTNVEISRYDAFRDRTIYTFPNHSLESRDTLTFARAFPKKSGNFKGVAKPSFKLTQDVTVPGVDESTSYTQPLIADISFSIPVGTTSAVLKELRQRIIALLDYELLMVALQEKLEV